MKNSRYLSILLCFPPAATVMFQKWLKSSFQRELQRMPWCSVQHLMVDSLEGHPSAINQAVSSA